MARSIFIREHTTVAPAALVPEFQLHQVTEVTPLWQATEDTLSATGLPPPYWAFPWVGGQAVARHVLDHPELVAGRVVLDFAAGCGLIALAALRAGAAAVRAVDIDPFARAAILLNAELNRAELNRAGPDRTGLRRGEAPSGVLEVWGADVIGQPLPGVEVVLAGDVCYERPMAEAVMGWLRSLAGTGRTVIIGDPGRSYLPRTGLVALATHLIATNSDVEDTDRKVTTVWRVLPA